MDRIPGKIRNLILWLLIYRTSDVVPSIILYVNWDVLMAVMWVIDPELL